jgi:hypothetical protein
MWLERDGGITIERAGGALGVARESERTYSPARTRVEEDDVAAVIPDCEGSPVWADGDPIEAISVGGLQDADCGWMSNQGGE